MNNKTDLIEWKNYICGKYDMYYKSALSKMRAEQLLDLMLLMKIV